jgi:sec-independent protein translocase protein TatA
MGRMFEPWHLIVLVGVAALLFGGKRLPDAARGLGRSLRIFKSEIRQLNDDAPASSSQQQPTARPQTTAPLEGRVMKVDTPRSTTPTEQRRDA